MPGEIQGARITQMWIDGVEYPVKGVTWETATPQSDPIRRYAPRAYECTFTLKMSNRAIRRYLDWVRMSTAWWAPRKTLHIRRYWRGKARKRGLKLLGAMR